MSNDKEVKAQLLSQHGNGNVTFAVLKAIGLVAFRKPTEDEYLDLLGSVGAPQESSGIAREQFVETLRVHPTEPSLVSKFRVAIRSNPTIVEPLARLIEASAICDIDDFKPTPERRKELDQKWEFGWFGVVPAGHSPIIIASDETSGALVRVASDAKENGDRDNGRKIRSAVLSMVRECEQSSVEALLSEWPATLKLLWYRSQEQANDCILEVGKD
jgi:hypothetical protein